AKDDPAWLTARRAALVLGLGLAASALLMLVRDDGKIFDLVPEGWQPGVLHDKPTRTAVLYWVMWPGIGMIMAGGIAALVLRWRLLAEAFRGMRGAGGGS